MSSPHQRTSNFEAFVQHALAADLEARAAFEDAQSRGQLVDALVRLRRRLGLTQTQVASAMGVKQPTVSGFETEGSDPRLSTLQRYAHSVDAVLVWTVQPRQGATSPKAYVEAAQGVSASTNTEGPTERARGWMSRKPYTAVDAA